MKTHYVIKGRVHTSAHLLWQTLIEKIYHPEKYIKDATQVKIEKIGENHLRRKMMRGDRQVTEVIEINEETQTTTFHLEGHPNYSGFISSQILPIKKGEEEPYCNLSYELDWDLMPQAQEDVHIFSWLSKAFITTKEAAEKTSR